MKNKLVIKLEFSVLLYLIIDKKHYCFDIYYCCIIFPEIYLYNDKKKKKDEGVF